MTDQMIYVVVHREDRGDMMVEERGDMMVMVVVSTQLFRKKKSYFWLLFPFSG